MSVPAIASIIYRKGECPDAAMADAVRRMEARGLRVGGLLQAGDRSSATRCASLALHDIGSGRQVPLFESRGAGARGCRLNPSGLAEASGWLREAIERRVDVLVVNRFGRQEAEGAGLLNEIAAAIMAEIPVVVAVDEDLLSAWQAFLGEAPVALAPDAERIASWCLASTRSLAA